MTDEELFFLDSAGLIPGPNETEKDFLARASDTKKRFETGDWIPPAHWDFPKEQLSRLFNVKPLYICAFYSGKGLTPWQGAATWIENKRPHSIQLKPAFRKGKFLFYSREEVLAHEAVHASRAAFDEDRFEEFFAFMTSEKKWRQVLGPVLQRPWEAWPLFAASLLGYYLLGALWAGLGFIRLFRNHRTLAKAAAQVLKETGDASRARAILFRLTDEEIEGLAGGETIASYALKRHDLRWKVIKRYYGQTDSHSGPRVEEAREPL